MQSSKFGPILGAVLALMLVSPVSSQDHGNGGHGGGGGGGGGCGDVFGDLVHILRDLDTGQPILQKRWIEYPGDVYNWGYCPIAIDASGDAIPFAEVSCDPLYPEAVVEVDYFGRLNGGRTKVRNQRMHFNEVIDNIKMSCEVKQDETGRLKIGYCDGPDKSGNVTEWAIVDSPMESMGLYVRLMKFGHLQTDPMEEDTWSHGDPATMPQYHPALSSDDWDKFHKTVRHLLPGDGDKDVREWCIADPYGCAEREYLTDRDLVTAGAFMAGAANKTGWITDDLTQYFNRIVKITLDTDKTGTYPDATLATLPALIRECPTVTAEPVSGEEPAYDYLSCTLYEGDETAPWPANERFVDFAVVDYERQVHREEIIEGVFPLSEGDLWAIFEKKSGVQLLDWLMFRNGYQDVTNGIGGFVEAASDSLRTIEFLHNYAIPEDLGVLCGEGCRFPELEAPPEE